MKMTMTNKMHINDVLKEMSKVATAMCNPDSYLFKCEVMDDNDPQVIVNCYGLGCAVWCDCDGYCYDLARRVEEFMNKYYPVDGYTWNVHSETNYWVYSKDENGDVLMDEDFVEGNPDSNSMPKEGECVQYCIFAEEN